MRGIQIAPICRKEASYRSMILSRVWQFCEKNWMNAKLFDKTKRPGRISPAAGKQ
jgi:hypothetical protein